MFQVEALRMCHTRDTFDEGRRAMQRAQPSTLGLLARRNLGMTGSRSSSPLRVGIVTRSAEKDMRRIHNTAALLSLCPELGVVCEAVALDTAGFVANVKLVLHLHALVALHGSHVTYAAFPPRPLAVLEVKPHHMPVGWFQSYFPAFFALDTWYYVHHASKEEHRAGADTKAVQQQAAVLPLPIFRDFVCDVLRRFARHTASIKSRHAGVMQCRGQAQEDRMR